MKGCPTLARTIVAAAALVAVLPGAEDTAIELGRPRTSRKTVPVKAPMALMLTKMLVCWPT